MIRPAEFSYMFGPQQLHSIMRDTMFILYLTVKLCSTRLDEIQAKTARELKCP